MRTAGSRLAMACEPKHANNGLMVDAEAGLVGLLEDVLGDPATIEERIKHFQDAVWSLPESTTLGGQDVRELLRTLAYDLDFFVADPRARAEDPSYFGVEQALGEIRDALEKLRRLEKEQAADL